MEQTMRAIAERAVVGAVRQPPSGFLGIDNIFFVKNETQKMAIQLIPNDVH